MEIGPALPPHLLKNINKQKVEERQNCALGKEETSSRPLQDDENSDEDECYGPALPPGFQKKKEEVTRVKVIGPMRPPESVSAAALSSNAVENTISSDEDGDVIGPTLPTAKKDAKPKRETWMTELPPDLSKNFGLGPRKFRARAVEVGDQSVWTDTPADKARKSKEGNRGSKRGGDDDEPVRTPWEITRDQQMTKQVESHNKRHRGESLMDMHTKKIEKQKKEDKDKPVERRPFDRDQDLNLPKMTGEQKKSVIQKSKELGSRFQHSRSGSSFL
ncbi:hypothetical protein pdam_00001211 [Pocillopora damicornis]|uniref:DUF3752 domain-containing protein n=1 Tax=Pocillopora damicornis TaxID=46731 RepID=A0A3M6TKR1_POCDA|nr:hypothetical protein pdam_00001211 [Pocillopora damicornis]